jgi:EAL domain-containing protein (putative c-di-GMP-specific phosphodiesterase class I)
MRRQRTSSEVSGRWVPWALTGAAMALGYTAGRERLQRGDGRSTPPVRGTSADSATHQEVRRLIDARRFSTVFQPVFSLRDGGLVAVEALTRFDAAEPLARPAVCPSLWFRTATEVGLGAELELAAIDAALGSGAALTTEVPLSVNVSPATLGDPRLEGLLGAHPDRQVILEVTEHAIVTDYPALAGAVGRLRDRGYLLAVDDAGAGFASLRHVVRLAPDIIKLDASLTQEIEHDRMRRALASSLILFAHRTGSRLVVEGIERPADLAVWHELGADAVQGYLLARPGPLADWQDGPLLITSTTRTVPIRPEPWRRTL